MNPIGIRVGWILVVLAAGAASTAGCGEKTRAVSPGWPHYEAVLAWGAPGSGPGQFAFDGDSIDAGGLAVDAAGQVFVADWGNDRVQVFDADGSFVRQWGSRGSGDGQLTRPTRLALGPDGSVYVTDSGNRRVQRFGNDGTFVSAWGTGTPSYGALELPGGIGVAAGGNVSVLDHGRAWLIQFDPAGGYLKRFRAGDGVAMLGGWFVTSSLAIAPDGNIYLSSSGSAVASYDANGTSRGLIGSRGSDRVGLVGDIATDAESNVYVADWQYHRVRLFDGEGVFLRVFGSPGSGLGQLDHPCAIAVDASGNVYVADAGNCRIQKFSPLR